MSKQTKELKEMNLDDLQDKLSEVNNQLYSINFQKEKNTNTSFKKNLRKEKARILTFINQK